MDGSARAAEGKRATRQAIVKEGESDKAQVTTEYRNRPMPSSTGGAVGACESLALKCPEQGGFNIFC